MTLRVSTYQKRLENVLKYRPRFENETLEATVTLTGEDNVPMIDITLKDQNDQVVSIGADEARSFAQWVRKVVR